MVELVQVVGGGFNQAIIQLYVKQRLSYRVGKYLVALSPNARNDVVVQFGKHVAIDHGSILFGRIFVIIADEHGGCCPRTFVEVVNGIVVQSAVAAGTQINAIDGTVGDDIVLRRQIIGSGVQPEEGILFDNGIAQQQFVAHGVFYGLSLYADIGIGDLGIIDHMVFVAFHQPDSVPEGVILHRPVVCSVSAERHGLVFAAVYMQAAPPIAQHASVFVKIHLGTCLYIQLCRRIHNGITIDDVGFVVLPGDMFVLMGDNLARQAEIGRIGENEMHVLSRRFQYNPLFGIIGVKENSVRNHQRIVGAVGRNIDTDKNIYAVAAGYLHIVKLVARTAVYI